MLLGEIVKQISGVTYQKAQASTKPIDGYKVILRAGNISESRILESDYVYVPKNLIKSDRLLKYGDILIAASSGSLSVVGKAAMLEADMDAGFGAFCRVLRPNVEIVFPRFLKFFFETEYYKNTIKHLAAGANINNLKSEHFHNLKISLPPLSEQQKIAAILDAADSLRQKDQQLVERYTTLSQSLFLEMFGDPITNPKGWRKPKLGSLVRIERGGSPRPISEYLGGTYPWIKIGDATKGNEIYLENTKEHLIEGGLNKTRLLPAGSIIFANCGVSLGFARIITFSGCIHDGWLSFSDIDEKVLNKIFILKTLNSITNYFRSSAPEGTQPNLNTSIMKSFEFILPPIEMQNKFAESIQFIEAQKQQAQRSLEKSEALFYSLLQRAFTGELTAKTAA